MPHDVSASRSAALVCISLFLISSQHLSSQQIDTGAKTMMRSADMSFAVKAAQGGAAEVQLGQLAASKSSRPDVKAFGQKMVDDHTKVNDDLAAVAQKENATLPRTMTAKNQSEYNRMQNLSGDAFDRAYVARMVKDHEQDVKEFQKEVAKGKDPLIKAFASQTLPVLQSHLDIIKSIQSKMGGG